MSKSRWDIFKTFFKEYFGTKIGSIILSPQYNVTTGKYWTFFLNQSLPRDATSCDFFKVKKRYLKICLEY